VDSGRILIFVSDPDPESKYCEKQDPGMESLSISSVAGVCVAIS